MIRREKEMWESQCCYRLGDPEIRYGDSSFSLISIRWESVRLQCRTCYLVQYSIFLWAGLRGKTGYVWVGGRVWPTYLLLLPDQHTARRACYSLCDKWKKLCVWLYLSTTIARPTPSTQSRTCCGRSGDLCGAVPFLLHVGRV